MISENHKKWLYTCICLISTILTLLLWSRSPIYPDEIATRMTRWSFNSSENALLSLYSLCKGSITDIPLLFVPSAKALYHLNQILSVTQARVIPFILVVLLASLTTWYSLKNSKPAWLSLMLCAAFIGLTGSSLIMLRSETAVYFNIIMCVFSMILLAKENPALSIRYFALAVLVFSCTLSAFYHPQGILYIPVSAFIAYFLLPEATSKMAAAAKMVLCLSFFGYIFSEGMQLLSLNCDNYPALDQARLEAAPRLGELLKSANINEIPHYLYEKFARYSYAFTYHENYDINYLPNVPTTTILKFVNKSIAFILISTLALSAMILANILISPIVLSRNKAAHPNNWFVAIVYSLLFGPTVFLLLYDSNMNFYRAHFIHFLLVITLMLGIGSVKNRPTVFILKVYTMFSVVIFLISFGLNYHEFHPIHERHAGPSTTPISVYKRSAVDISSVSQSCLSGKKNGKVVVDDLTYDAFRLWNKTYPITYLHLQMIYTSKTPKEVILELKPDVIIARCSSLESARIGWPPDFRQGEICCTIPSGQ